MSRGLKPQNFEKTLENEGGGGGYKNLLKHGAVLNPMVPPTPVTACKTVLANHSLKLGILLVDHVLVLQEGVVLQSHPADHSGQGIHVRWRKDRTQESLEHGGQVEGAKDSHLW